MKNKKVEINSDYANSIGVPKDEMTPNGWMGSWKKAPMGRLIGTAYTHYAVIWDNILIPGRVVYYHCQEQPGKLFLLQ